MRPPAGTCNPFRNHEPQRFEGIVAIATDNATLLAAYRYYSKLDIYEGAYVETGRNLSSMIKLLYRASRHKDSMKYLQEWTGRRNTPGGNVVLRSYDIPGQFLVARR